MNIHTDKAVLVVAAATAAFIAGFSVAQTMTQTGHEPQFDNAAVRVWKSFVLPDNPLPFHRHDHPRVLIALKGGTMKILEETGKSELHEWQTGKAYWLPANQLGSRPEDVTVGDQPIEVMVVELQNTIDSVIGCHFRPIC